MLSCLNCTIRLTQVCLILIMDLFGSASGDANCLILNNQRIGLNRLVKRSPEASESDERAEAAHLMIHIRVLRNVIFTQPNPNVDALVTHRERMAVFGIVNELSHGTAGNGARYRNMRPISED